MARAVWVPAACECSVAACRCSAERDLAGLVRWRRASRPTPNSRMRWSGGRTAGKHARRGGAGGGDPGRRPRTAVRGRRGLSGAAGGRELPPAPEPARGHREPHRGFARRLQRHCLDLQQRHPDLSGRRLCRALRVHGARVLRGRAAAAAGRSGSRLLALESAAAATPASTTRSRGRAELHDVRADRRLLQHLHPLFYGRLSERRLRKVPSA